MFGLFCAIVDVKKLLRPLFFGEEREINVGINTPYRRKLFPHIHQSSKDGTPNEEASRQGARCSVLVKLLRPSREVVKAFPNPTAQQRVKDLIATHLGMTGCQGNNFESVFFTSATIPGIMLSCTRRNCVGREKGHPNGQWDVPMCAPRMGWGVVLVAEVVDEPAVEIDDEIF